MATSQNPEKKLSRRDFIKGSAAVGLGIAFPKILDRQTPDGPIDKLIDDVRSITGVTPATSLDKIVDLSYKYAYATPLYPQLVQDDKTNLGAVPNMWGTNCEISINGFGELNVVPEKQRGMPVSFPRVNQVETRVFPKGIRGDFDPNMDLSEISKEVGAIAISYGDGKVLDQVDELSQSLEATLNQIVNYYFNGRLLVLHLSFVPQVFEGKYVDVGNTKKIDPPYATAVTTPSVWRENGPIDREDIIVRLENVTSDAALEGFSYISAITETFANELINVAADKSPQAYDRHRLTIPQDQTFSSLIALDAKFNQQMSKHLLGGDFSDFADGLDKIIGKILAK